MSEPADQFDDVLDDALGQFVDGLTDEEVLSLSPESHDRLIRLSHFRYATAEERLSDLRARYGEPPAIERCSGMTSENARADHESWLVFVPPRLRMYRLAAREHRHELRDLASTSLGALHRLDAMQNRVAILAGEPTEHRLRRRFSLKRSCQVVGHAGLRGASVGGLPTPVGRCALDLGDPRSLHPAFADQPLGECRVPLRPAAPWPPWRETLKVRSLVAAANLTVDPPEADRLLEGLVVGEARRREARRRGRALLRQYEHDARPIGVVAPEPLTPRARVRDNQFAVLTADPVTSSIARWAQSRSRTQ